MLSKRDFWERVKSLEGSNVYTLYKRSPNTIQRVENKYVYTKQRQTPILFEGEWGLYTNYEILHKDGYLSIKEKDGEGAGNASGSYLAMAIILAAVPEEVEEGNDGIRLRLKYEFS